MRVAYVCVDPGVPVFGTKGASVHIQEIIREFRSRGHEVRVYAVRRGNNVPEDLTDLNVVELPVDADDPREREHAQHMVSSQFIEKILADGVDLLYERYSLFSTVLADVCSAIECPGILEVNSPLIEEQRTHRILIDEETALRALQCQVQVATATICVSEQVRIWVTGKVQGGRVYVVPNGVNVTRIQPQPEAPGVPVVVFVGTLKPWHGVEDLIRAASMARNEWRLRIIGDGPQRTEIESLADQLGVEADFRGAVTPESMTHHLAGASIGVAPYPALTSDNDQYFSPLKIYEYLAAGLPVVASRVGQIPSILDGIGVLVPPSDPVALAESIDALASDPQRRAELGRQSRLQAEQQHSWSTVLDTILNLRGYGG